MSVTKAVKKNEIVTFHITGYTSEGSGVGRLNDQPDGLAVFVPHAAIGDWLKVRIVKPASHYAFGRIEEILSPSPDRISPDCDCCPPCGGCVFRHISYEAECQAKWEKVRDCLTRLGGIDHPTMEPIMAAPSPLRYRNKAEFPLGVDESGNPVLGFYAPRSHRIIPCRSCLLQPAIFDEIAAVFLQWVKQSGNPVYQETEHRGVLRHLYLRYAGSTGQVMVCVVANATQLKDEEELCHLLTSRFPQITSIILNRNQEKTNVILGPDCRTLYGTPELTDTLCGLQIRLSPLSFYQVNREQTQRLYQKAAELCRLTGQETLLDLYCGAGTIGLSMAHKVKKVIGVEIVPEAVENARGNAKTNGIQNAEFLCMDAPQAAQHLKEQGLTPDVVVLDPPRKGCGEALCHTVSDMAPARVVYVSCDPATLARDLTYFAANGYHLVTAVPVDLFPRTRHIETVVLLSKLTTKQHIEVELTAAESKAT